MLGVQKLWKSTIDMLSRSWDNTSSTFQRSLRFRPRLGQYKVLSKSEGSKRGAEFLYQFIVDLPAPFLFSKI